MASTYKELVLDTSADTAWAALRQAGEARALFAPVLVDSRVAGDIRTVRFANGSLVEERIITIDDERRRIVYAAEKGTPMTHHHASTQVIPEGAGRCRVVWITDLLPDSAVSSVSPLVDGGAQALKAIDLEVSPPGSLTSIGGALPCTNRSVCASGPKGSTASLYTRPGLAPLMVKRPASSVFESERVCRPAIQRWTSSVNEGCSTFSLRSTRSRGTRPRSILRYTFGGNRYDRGLDRWAGQYGNSRSKQTPSRSLARSWK